jgi:hypothetical protein
MKLYLTYIIIFFIIACTKSSYKKQSIKSVKALTIYTVYPADFVDNVLRHDTLKHKVFFIDNFTMLLNKVNMFSIDTIDDVNDTSLITASVKYQHWQYIIYTEGSKRGYLYDSIVDNIPKKIIDIDSFNKKRLAFNFYNYYNKLKLLNAFKRIDEGVTARQKDICIEKEVLLLPRNEKNHDTAIYYYTNKYDGYNFSFVPELDRLKKMKLFKISHLFNPIYSESLKRQLPRRELTVYMEPAVVEEPEKLKALCDRHAKYLQSK